MRLAISSKWFKRDKPDMVQANAYAHTYSGNNEVHVSISQPAAKRPGTHLTGSRAYEMWQNKLDVAMSVDDALQLAAQLTHQAEVIRGRAVPRDGDIAAVQAVK